MSKAAIPRKVVYRLSLYYRSLQQLGENEVKTVSSTALAKAAGVKPTQLRKDLAYFGQLGIRGTGYDVGILSNKLTDVLGTTHLQPVILVGVGHLGSALVRYRGFAKEGFEIVAGFDVDFERKRAETPLNVLPPAQLPTFVRENRVKMAILAVPSTVAQNCANELVAAGIQGILNFSATVLEVPEGVVVNNVDLAIELENLSYFIR